MLMQVGEHEYAWNSMRAQICWPQSNGTELREEGVTATDSNKQVKGTSLEK
jgi:hypothetical protein